MLETLRIIAIICQLETDPSYCRRQLMECVEKANSTHVMSTYIWKCVKIKNGIRDNKKTTLKVTKEKEMEDFDPCLEDKRPPHCENNPR